MLKILGMYSDKTSPLTPCKCAEIQISKRRVKIPYALSENARDDSLLPSASIKHHV
jgi:hypothetical protein